MRSSAQGRAPSSPTYTSTRESASRAGFAARVVVGRTHSATPPIPTRPPPRSLRRCVSAPARRCRAHRSPSAYPASPRKHSRSAELSRVEGHRRPCPGYWRGTASTRRSLVQVCPSHTVQLGTGSL
jgi:hypothetical protein